MCGINGYVGGTKRVIEAMNRATGHRGPDGTGSFSDGKVTLGHNLLAIAAQPGESQQPFFSPDRRYVLVYNGEIYNYRALRAELEALGETFSTSGDTEVVLKGMVRSGTAYLKKLDGMFAIGFYDTKTGVLILARDRSGMKPIYYMTNNGFAFSSELRGLYAYGLRPVLNMDAARSFFLFGYTATPETLTAGVKKVPPGAFFTIQGDGSYAQAWFGWEDRVEANASADPIVVRDKVGRAVRAHTMGLRPYGLLLSGGLDSTAILHELAGRETVRTYTTRFDTKDQRYNEDADVAKRLTSQYAVDHHELVVTEQAFIDTYEKAIETMEEPRYNHSVPAYWLLMQEAAKDVVVLLNGSGGDELFLGYPRYYNAVNLAKKYSRYPAGLLNLAYGLTTSGFFRQSHLPDLRSLPQLWAYVSRISPLRHVRMGGADLIDTAQMLAADAPPITDPLPDTVSAVAELDRFLWLANEEFMRTDKIAMHFGMEGRFPFLSHELIRYANGLSAEVKLAGGTKAVIRNAYRGVLPDYIIDKHKTGWNAPVSEWMQGRFGQMVREILSPEYYPATAELFDLPELAKTELDGKTSFDLPDLKRFLPIVQFQVWARTCKLQLP